MTTPNSVPQQGPIQPAIQQEFQFRLSLLRLMTVPHRPVPGDQAPAGGTGDGMAGEASRKIEELSTVLAPRARAS
ncbi:MAG: hypothetical protein R2729_15205 [Bryobacteraceae bacterium]